VSLSRGLLAERRCSGGISAGEGHRHIQNFYQVCMKFKNFSRKEGKKSPRHFLRVCFAFKEVSQLNIIETADGKMQTL